MRTVRVAFREITALSALLVPVFFRPAGGFAGLFARHYGDGLKTLELEPEVLDLFRPLVKSGSLPK